MLTASRDPQHQSTGAAEGGWGYIQPLPGRPLLLRAGGEGGEAPARRPSLGPAGGERSRGRLRAAQHGPAAALRGRRREGSGDCAGLNPFPHPRRPPHAPRPSRCSRPRRALTCAGSGCAPRAGRRGRAGRGGAAGPRWRAPLTGTRRPPPLRATTRKPLRAGAAAAPLPRPRGFSGGEAATLSFSYRKTGLLGGSWQGRGVLACSTVPKRENELPVPSGSGKGPCPPRDAGLPPVQGTPRASQRVSCFFFPVP